MNSKEIESINVSKLQIEKMYKAIKNLPEETPISFEFILTALFPTVWDNIQKTMRDYYTKGYIEGLKEGKENESKRIN